MNTKDNLTEHGMTEMVELLESIYKGDRVIVEYVIPYDSIRLYRVEVIDDILDNECIITECDEIPVGIPVKLLIYNDENLKLVESSKRYLELQGLIRNNRNFEIDHILINGLKGEECLKTAIESFRALEKLKGDKQRADRQHEIEVNKKIWDAVGGDMCNFPNPYMEDLKI